MRASLFTTFTIFSILCGCGAQGLRKSESVGRIDELTSNGVVWVTRDFVGSSELPGALFAFAFLENGRIEQWLIDERENGMLVYQGKYTVSESGAEVSISIGEKMNDGHRVKLLIENTTDSKVICKNVGQDNEPSRRLTFTVHRASDFDAYRREKE